MYSNYKQWIKDLLYLYNDENNSNYLSREERIVQLHKKNKFHKNETGF